MLVDSLLVKSRSGRNANSAPVAIKLYTLQLPHTRSYLFIPLNKCDSDLIVVTEIVPYRVDLFLISDLGGPFELSVRFPRIHAAESQGRIRLRFFFSGSEIQRGVAIRCHVLKSSLRPHPNVSVIRCSQLRAHK